MRANAKSTKDDDHDETGMQTECDPSALWIPHEKYHCFEQWQQ